MKIAIYHNLPSGGAKRALYETVKRLAPKHQFGVFTLSTSNQDFGDLRPYCDSHKVYPFKPLPLLESPLGRLNQLLRRIDLVRIQRVNRQVAAEIGSGGFNLAYLHPCQFENSPSVLRYLNEVPSLFFCQEPLRLLYEQMPERPYDRKHSRSKLLMDRMDPLPGIYFGALKRQDRQNIRSAQSVLVNSAFMQQAVQSIYAVKPRVNYLGVDSEFFRPMETPESDFVLSVGSLTPLKGFDFLIRSLARIPATARPALKIISNFANLPEREYLTDLAREHQVDLDLVSGASEEELRAAYNQALLTVYAPVREPFGLVTIESMACGTPVVAVREGGIQETVIHDQVGLLVDRDEHAFAEAVQSLLADPGRREALGRNGRGHVEKTWSWESAVERVETAFEYAAALRS